MGGEVASSCHDSGVVQRPSTTEEVQGGQVDDHRHTELCPRLVVTATLRGTASKAVGHSLHSAALQEVVS